MMHIQISSNEIITVLKYISVTHAQLGKGTRSVWFPVVHKAMSEGHWD